MKIALCDDNKKNLTMIEDKLKEHSRYPDMTLYLFESGTGLYEKRTILLIPFYQLTTFFSFCAHVPSGLMPRMVSIMCAWGLPSPLLCNAQSAHIPVSIFRRSMCRKCNFCKYHTTLFRKVMDKTCAVLFFW